MSEDKNTLLSTLAEPISNATNNIVDKPTQNVGTTLADIWYLVFGGISQAAEKRKLKYSYALQEFENVLKEKINKIPEEKLIEPDIQVVAPALEAAKYCMEKSELKNMFVNLISSAMNKEKTNFVHPIFTNIISRLSSEDALLLQSISTKEFDTNSVIFSETIERLSFSLSILKTLGLIESKDLALEDFKEKSQIYKDVYNEMVNETNTYNGNYTHINNEYDNILHIFTNYMKYNKFSGDKLPKHDIVAKYFTQTFQLTALGQQFIHICMD